MGIRSTVDGRLHNEHPHQKMSVWGQSNPKTDIFGANRFHCRYAEFSRLQGHTGS